MPGTYDKKLETSAAKLAFTEEGYICSYASVYEQQSASYVESQEERRRCLFLASSPDDTLLWVDPDRSYLWTVFVVI